MTGDIPSPMSKIRTKHFPQCFILKCNEQTLHSRAACIFSHFSHVRFFETLWTVAHQASLSMGFSRQEYWNGLSALLQRIFPTQGLNSRLLSLLHRRRVLHLLSQLGSHISTYTSPKCLNVGGPQGPQSAQTCPLIPTCTGTSGRPILTHCPAPCGRS